MPANVTTAKFSQLGFAGAIASSDSVVGVSGGQTDVQYTFSQLALSVQQILNLGSLYPLVIGTTQILDGANGFVLFNNGGSLGNIPVLGGTGVTVSVSTSVAISLSNNGVGDQQIRQGSPVSVIGVAGNATTNVADIPATGGGQILQTNSGGTGLIWGSVGSSILPGPFQVASFTTNGVVYGNGTSALGATAAGTASYILTGNGSALPPSFQQLSLTASVTGVLTVPFGGSGTSTLTAFGVVFGNGTSTVGITSSGIAGQAFLGQTATSSPLFKTIAGDISVATTGTATIATAAVTFSKMQNVTGLSVLGIAGTATGPLNAITGTANQVLFVNGGATGLVFGQILLPAMVTGVLPVVNGGTGTSTLSANGVLLGNGTSAVGISTVPTAGQLFVGQTTTGAPSWQNVSLDISLSSSGTATVVGLQGRSLLSTAPTTSQIISWNGIAWTPATASLGITNLSTGWGLAGGPISTVGTISVATTNPPYGFTEPVNLQLNAMVLTGVLTISIVGNNGSAPSATNPVLIPFRDSALASGDPQWVAIATSLSISTFSTGATLGATNGVPFRLWIIAFQQNATTVMPALINCSNSSQIIALADNALATSVAIGSTATSIGIFYTPNGTTVGNRPFKVLGFAEFASGLTAAGTYSTVPTTVQLYGVGGRLPGMIVQTVFPQFGSLGTTTIATTVTTTNVSASIVPTSPINLVRYAANVSMTGNTTTIVVYGLGQMYRNGNAIGAVMPTSHIEGAFAPLSVMGIDSPATTASLTYLLKASVNTSSGILPAQSANSAVQVLDEIMG